jgi:hypothetical protein
MMKIYFFPRVIHKFSALFVEKIPPFPIIATTYVKGEFSPVDISENPKVYIRGQTRKIGSPSSINSIDRLTIVCYISCIIQK